MFVATFMIGEEINLRAVLRILRIAYLQGLFKAPARSKG